MPKRKPEGYRGVPSKERAKRLLERKTQILAEYNSDLSEKQLRFADWWAQPKELRFPPSQKMLAEHLGVTEQSLCEWKRNGLLAGLWRELSQLYEVEYNIPQVIRVLYQKAIGGSINACKFYLDIMGASAPKSVKVEHVGILGVIQEQVASLPVENLKLISDTLEDMRETDN